MRIARRSLHSEMGGRKKGSSVEKKAWNGERSEDETLGSHDKSCFAAACSCSILGSLTPASKTLSSNLLNNEPYKRLGFFTTSCNSPWGKAEERGQQTAHSCTITSAKQGIALLLLPLNLAQKLLDRVIKTCNLIYKTFFRKTKRPARTT